MSENILEVKNLSKYFNVGKNATLKAVDNVSFNIKRGETLGLVGESGCGKTTCGRTVLRLYDPTHGEIIFNGEKISNYNKRNFLKFKKNAQMIFQDPYSSLNPRMTIFEIVSEGLNVHYNLSKEEKSKKVNEILYAVGLTESFGNRFPHELSGGQCQRIGIARSLIVEPEFIVCDEPISALDVSIQAQIVNLLIKLQQERKLTYLFISHDLSMVKHISDRIGVMYLGSMVELTTSERLFEHTLHPYTQVLLSAIPDAEPDQEKQKNSIKIEGEVPSPINPPKGCKFSTRCCYANDLCKAERPVLKEVEKGHFVACHQYEKFM
ncbi:ATP-binding cassette domain-containing protein [Sedimentibacter sp. zth1]|uniref:ABC transporter ATP-binding protein n=1 Tax=Sedimentibacter sp. zth1 TaxID=2816908 RepID=UPI001A92017A|nr:oligopeptide/dipeptide ABC transporter ATP-binding protein [Sedimentibacter sp. zth1]QSX06166.1 ATP-binding cassette domain-containing protein [Sedimentibacter sp. zth1]